MTSFIRFTTAATLSVALLFSIAASCVAAQAIYGGQLLRPPSDRQFLRNAEMYDSLFSFDGENGGTPTTSLTRLGDNLYGTAPGGGNGFGVVYAITAGGVQHVLYNFQGPPDGESPGALLSLRGKMYGTTAIGGQGKLCRSSFGCGAIFSFDPRSGEETILYSFQGGADGAVPSGALIELNGTLYGTTSQGGDGYGTVFAVSTSGAEQVLYRFRGGNDGATPLAGLLNVSGVLYGTTYYGGRGQCGSQSQASGCGTVYSINTSGAERVLYRFKGGADAHNPAVTLDKDASALYGVTYRGGVSNNGAVFDVQPSGHEHVVYSFKGNTDGSLPLAGLTNVDGILYGTTYGGGTNACSYNTGCGTVFRVSPRGEERVLYRFKGMPDGSNPEASLVNLGGTLYGTTTFGGANSCVCGTVFAWTL